MEIRNEKMSDEFEKHHIEGLPFSAVIHHFTAPDKAGAHDHPFGFTTHILKGSYVERRYSKEGRYVDLHRKQGSSHNVDSTTIHEIIALPDGDCYTIITPGQWEREPGFWKFENGKAYFKQWNESEFKEQ